MITHLSFDALAWVVAGLIAWGQSRTHPGLASPARHGQRYLLAVVGGTLAGTWVLGTANLWLAGLPGAGRSILGALVGGIIGAESYKAVHGLRGSTGAAFVLPVAVGVAVGRIGCLLAGLEDQTHGIPTPLPWGWDFGDGIPRHPVQLYESLSMLTFAMAWVLAIRHRPHHAATIGFPVLAGWYAVQRLVWEALKPYPPLVGPLSLFQIVCLLLLVYSVVMVTRGLRR